jgi:ribosome recycling factor
MVDEQNIRLQMQKVVDMVTGDISGIRTGRATPSLVENLVVAVYGGAQKLRVMELGTISASDPQTLVIDPWDKSIIGDIRKGVMEANIGMNPSIDGQIIRIVLPPLTTEDREKYVKLLSGKLENGRIAVRQVRADGMHEVKRSFEAKELSEDEKFAAEKHVQEITDEFIRRIDELGEKKRQELLQM